MPITLFFSYFVDNCQTVHRTQVQNLTRHQMETLVCISASSFAQYLVLNVKQMNLVGCDAAKNDLLQDHLVIIRLIRPVYTERLRLYRRPVHKEIHHLLECVESKFVLIQYKIFRCTNKIQHIKSHFHHFSSDHHLLKSVYFNHPVAYNKK